MREMGPTRGRRLWIAAAAVLALALLPLPAAPAEEVDTEGARRVVRKALDDALAVLRDRSLPQEERIRRVEAIAFDQFDWPTVGRLVLARHWRRFSDEQQRAFVEEFQTLLSRRYSNRLERYRGEEVEIRDTRVEPRGDVTVLTEVASGQYEGVAIDYRMRRRADTWRAIDVTIEGVSLVGSYRSQFSELLGRKSPDELLELLRERNARPAAESDDDAADDDDLLE